VGTRASDKEWGMSNGGRYYISDEQFDLYGVGATLAAARADYWLAVQDYYADLTADTGRLAPYLAEHLAQLQTLLGTGENPTL